MALKIGINGLGRIGRMVIRAIIENKNKNIEIKHINNRSNSETSCSLLKYDSIHGKFNADIKFDKKHPQKRKLKPLASGKISISFAYFSIAILSIISIFILLNNKNLINVFLIYIIMNVFYSFFLKSIPILDIFILSFNYILRVYAGCVIIDASLSSWMAITIFAGAIFISALKRRQEIIMYGTSSRPVLKKYSINYLNKIKLSS